MGEEVQETLQRRRQKHREAMRLHRQRHGKNLDRMRVTLETLSQQFRQLGQVAAGSSQLMKDYRELALSSQQLLKEQKKLQSSVDVWEKLMERMTLLLAEQTPVKAALVPVPTRQVQDASPTMPFRFQELSESGMHQVIRRCSVNLRLCQATSAAESQPPPLGAANVDSNFGWSITWDLSNESDVFVKMTKRLPGVTAHQAIVSTWDTTDNPALYPRAAPLNQELVQVLPERAYIEVHDMPTYGHLAAKKQRSCMMCFKVKTERGYAVGIGNVSPELVPKDDSKAEFVEHSSWTEVIDDIDGSCVATISYRGKHSTGMDPYQRFVKLFSCVRRWEDLITGQPLKLVS